MGARVEKENWANKVNSLNKSHVSVVRKGLCAEIPPTWCENGKLRGKEKIQFLNKKRPKKETCFTSCLNNGFYQKLPKLGAKWFGCWSRALSVLPRSANDNRTALQNPSQGLQLEKNASFPSRLMHQAHPSHFNTSNKTRFENKLYIESTGQCALKNHVKVIMASELSNEIWPGNLHAELPGTENVQISTIKIITV